MKFLKILTESRVDDFKTKYATKFSPEQLNKIVDNIPQKFLDWVGKKFDSINFNDGLNDLSTKLREFEKISSNLPKTDINSYQSIRELSDALSAYANKPRRDYKEVEGGKVVYDDGKYFVVNPQTHQSSCHYGRGTKWCTVADSDYQFNQYNKEGKLFYILDRTLETTDPFYKVALLRKFDGNNTFWDAKDDTTMILPAQMGSNSYEKMMSAIENYMSSEYAEQIKIFTDKELARKERDRQESLRIARILNDRREEAKDRRTENEWQLGPDCPEDGLKAHALLEWLVDQGDVDARTPEQTARLMMLEDLLPQLQEQEIELENEGEDISEISDRIYEVETEILELSDKIDVYNIIPTGDYYDMDEFEVIDAGLDDRRYAVGDEDEVKSSCEEKVDQLIDDIGYEGFSRGFAQSFIDAQQVADYAEDYWGDDVHNNPEVYLDESDRQLSESQEREISVLKYRISKTQKEIENLESILDVEENDWSINDKIEELEDLIKEFEGEIEEIENDPDGDFPDDLIQEKIEDLVEDARRDPEFFINEFGLDWENFIDKDEFIQGVIDADGYGHTLNGYDGSADEIKVQDTWYYVMRID
jgi:hypothetical protein